MKQIISNEDLCIKLNVTPRTLQNYRDKSLITFYQIGKKIYYEEKDVDEFLEKHKVPSKVFKKGGAYVC